MSEIDLGAAATATAGAAPIPDAAPPPPQPPPVNAQPRSVDFLLDVPLSVTVELGRSKMRIVDLLKLAKGSVMELDKIAGEPLDVRVNGHLIARGEAVIVNDKFGVRLSDVISPSERVRSLT